jgi:hypothetical protein
MADDDRSDREEEVQLPPAFLKFQGQLKADRKALLRDKAYAQSPEQLRAFIAQFLFPRLDEFVQLMGLALYDTYGLAVSSENQIQRMRAVYGKALEKLGADVGDESGDLPGVSPEVLDEFQQYFYALGTLLSKKLPEDKEVQTAFNKCAESLGDMVAELMGEDEDEDEDEEDDDEEEAEDGVERKPRKPKTPKPEAAEAEGSSKPNSDPSDGDV